MALNLDALNESALNEQGEPFVFSLVKNVVSGRKYKCTVTGAANGLPDVQIPLSNISIRMDEELVSTLSVVCPNGTDYADGIIARKDGSLILESIELYTIGTESSTDSQEYAITSISSTKGAFSFSVSLTAQTTLFNTTPKSIRLHGISMISQNEAGNTRVRCAPDKDVLPGDTVILDDLSEITISLVTTTIAANLSSMEVSD